MGHPIMFSDDDPTLAQVRRIALALPEATEKVAHGRPTFRCGKMFAMYGGSTRKTDSAPARRYDASLLFIADQSERLALEQDERFFYPAYVGAYGWLGLNLAIESGSGTIDWAEVAELIDASYRQIAPKRALAQLE